MEGVNWTSENQSGKKQYKTQRILTLTGGEKKKKLSENACMWVIAGEKQREEPVFLQQIQIQSTAFGLIIVPGPKQLGDKQLRDWLLRSSVTHMWC